jgi:hypothetical protein
MALFDNRTGDHNTACGDSALANNTAGANNVALGYEAGYNITTGSNNIHISNEGSSSDAGIIRIGVTNVQTNTYIAGIYGQTVSSTTGTEVFVDSAGQLGTVNSSARFKRNIRSMEDASNVLLAMRPVTFQYKTELDPQGVPQFGLIAEEVEKVDPDLVVRDAKNQILTVRYSAVNAMLLNEFLKQHRTIEEQKTEIGEQEATIATLQGKAAKVDSLEKRLNELEQTVQLLSRAK